MSSIKDVANAAGVSVSTVSNIINNKNSVNIDIYNRVIRVMKELDYRPNIFASNLRKNRMNFVGAVFNYLSGHYEKLLEGILQTADELGYQVIVKLVHPDMNEEKKEIESLLSIGVRGVILCSPNIHDDILDPFENANIPILTLDHCLPQRAFFSVDFDNADAVRKVAESLLAGGESVGLLTGPASISSESRCREGYESAVAHGERHVLELPFNRSNAYSRLIEKVAKADRMPDNLILSNELFCDLTRDVLEMYGFGNRRIFVLSSESAEAAPPSGVVRVPRDALRCGREAVKTLVGQIKDPIISDSKARVVGFRRQPNLYADRHIAIPRPCTLRVLLPDAPMSRSIAMLARDFMLRSGCEVQFEKVNMTHLRERIQAADKNPEGAYDIITFNMNWLSDIVGAGYIVPLEPYLDTARMIEEYLPQLKKAYFQKSRKVYAMPVEMGVQILAYREDVFENLYVRKNYYNQMGLDLQPPRSWTEYNTIAGFFTRARNPGSVLDYGTCIAGHNPTGLIEEFWPRRVAFHGKLFEGHAPCFDSAQNVKALTNLCESYRYSYPDCRAYMDSEQVERMLTDEIAMIVTYSSYMVLQNARNNARMGKSIRFSKTPSNLTVIDSYLMGITQNSRNPEAAARFIEWCCSDEIARKSMMLGRIIPKNNVVLNAEIQYQNLGLKDMYNNIENAVTREAVTRPDGQAVNYTAFDQILGDAFSKAVYKNVPASEVMGSLQRYFEKNGCPV